MESERYSRLKAIFETAQELPADERQQHVARACGGDKALLGEVQELLRAAAEAGAFLSTGSEGSGSGAVRAVLSVADAEPLSLVGQRIGRYTVGKLIATGGMGWVYEAEQDSPRRIVALKVMRQGISSRAALRRFEYETEILARLRHEGIAQIYEAGVSRGRVGAQEGSRTSEQDERNDRGLPYFAMEYVEGARAITEYAEEKSLSVRERLELFEKVCDAVQHGHQKGVIHRDLKPSNILVDRTGAPKVIDFGVARATDCDVAMTTRQTDVGQLIGTLQYMSPEQIGGVGGEARDVDVRSDVYALGVVLYELLCGTLPYDVSRAGLLEAARVIREEQPARPSTVTRIVRGDLETVTLKALEKDRERRYQSAAELGQDIRRYLNGEGIVARPPTLAYQFRTFARRHKAVFGSMAAVIAVLAGAVVVVSMMAVELREQRDAAAESERIAVAEAERAERGAERALAAEAAAEERAGELEQVAEFQAAQLSGIDVAQMGTTLRADLLERARESLERGGLDSEQLEQNLAELERLIRGVNFTDAALALLKENIFERALAAIEEKFGEQPLVRARMLESVARTMLALGMLQRALELQNTALTLYLEVLDADDERVLVSLHRKSALLWENGLYQEAEAYALRAIRGMERVLGPAHAATLGAKSTLGRVHGAQGRMGEAESSSREVMEIARDILGEEHPDTLMYVANLATLLFLQGRYSEAEALYREELAIRRRPGQDEIHVLTALRNLATVHRATGRLAEAKELYLETLDGLRRIRGEMHPLTLHALMDIGDVLRVLGRHEEAEQYLRDSLAGYRATLGKEHPETLSAINSMGVLFLQSGRAAQAEKYLREALEVRERMLGADHHFTLNTMNNLGVALRSQGKLDEAEALGRRSVDGQLHALGEQHPNTLVAMTGLALVLEERGQLEEAERYYRRVIDIRRSTLAEGHPEQMQTLAQIAGLLRSQRRFAEAEPFLREILEINRRVHGADDERTLDAMQELATLLRALGEVKGAESLLREVVEGRGRALGDDHPETINSMNSLAVLLGLSGRNEEAAEVAAHGVLRARAALPGDHWYTASLLATHGRVLLALERYEEAAAALEEGQGIFSRVVGPGHGRSTTLLADLARLYERWHALEPDGGHEAKATYWRGEWQKARGGTEGR